MKLKQTIIERFIKNKQTNKQKFTMYDPADSIVKLFESSSLSVSEIASMVEWLQKTPKTTTIRVNLLRNSSENARNHITKAIMDLEHLIVCPKIDLFQPIPEILLIQNIDENCVNDRPNERYKEIMVDVSCGVAVLRGSHIYAPGVLAMESNTQTDEIVNVFVDIEGCCKKGTKKYESTYKKFIGIGQVKMQRHQLYRTDICPKGIAIQMHETISCVPSIGSDFLGDHLGLLQNFPSIICGRVLDPKPNENVLDMCASPGNKTTHLAQLMNDSGRIIALDKSKSRVELLKGNIQRFGFECVECFCFDATKACSAATNNGSWTPPFDKETFDKILLDAPCSGLGNRPILTVSKTLTQSIKSFPKLQKKLLEVAINLLKVGGTLVYSTCSVLEAENELNVSWLLERYSNQIELVDATPHFGGHGFINAGLNYEQCRKVQRYGPHFEQNTEQNQLIDTTGFFICKLKKVSSV